MFDDITLSVPTAILESLPEFTAYADLLVKASLLVMLSAGLIYMTRQYFKSSSRHLFWVNAILSLALLPCLPMLSGWSGNNSTLLESEATAPALKLFTFSAVPAETQEQLTVAAMPEPGLISYLPAILVGLYLVPCLFLLAKLAFSALFILRIRTMSDPESDLDAVIRLNRLKMRFNVTRPVVLKFSNHVESPASYGLFRPEIVFPESARKWPDRVFESALLHEFAHIQRLDWLTSAVAYVICCFYWLNPLVWFALRQLNQEAENACDSAVVQSGVSEDDYAEDLLTVTRTCKHAGRQELLAQSVFGAGSLKQRVELLLSRSEESRSRNRLLNAMPFLGSLLLLVMFSSSSVIGVHALTSIDVQGGRSLSVLWADYRQFENDLKNSTAYREPNQRTDGSDELTAEFEPVAAVSPIDPVPEMPDIESAFESYAAAGLAISRKMLASEFARSEIQIAGLNRFSDVAQTPSGSVPDAAQIDSSAAAPAEKPFLITTRMTRPEDMSRSELRSEIQRVETLFFEGYNELTPNKQLHVNCSRYRPSNSYIKRWVCEPRFITDGHSDLARENFARLSMASAIGGSSLGSDSRTQVQALTTAINSALSKDEELERLYHYLSTLRAANQSW